MSMIEKLKPLGISSIVILIDKTKISNIYYDMTD